jgi:hypothetical protein
MRPSVERSRHRSDEVRKKMDVELFDGENKFVKLIVYKQDEGE